MERRYAQGLPGQPCPAQRACPVTGAMTGDLSDRSRTEMNELVFKAGGTPRPRPRPMSRPPSGRHTRTPPSLSSPRGPRTPLVLARQVADWAEQAAHRLEDPAQRHPAPRPAGRTAAADATGSVRTLQARTDLQQLLAEVNRRNAQQPEPDPADAHPSVQRRSRAAGAGPAPRPLARQPSRAASRAALEARFSAVSEPLRGMLIERAEREERERAARTGRREDY